MDGFLKLETMGVTATIHIERQARNMEMKSIIGLAAAIGLACLGFLALALGPAFVDDDVSAVDDLVDATAVVIE